MLIKLWSLKIPLNEMTTAMCTNNMSQQLTQRLHTSFAALGVDSKTVDVLRGTGIAHPSPIQEAAIPKIFAGYSCALQSCTGSGKTLAYLLPVIDQILRQRYKSDLTSGSELHRGRTIQAMVVTPSQELAMQIFRVARDVFYDKDKWPLVQHAIGGANPKRQHEAMKRYKPALVVGTPGRILDLIESGAIHPRYCPLLILDEIDQLSSRVFRAETEKISKLVGSKLLKPRQTVLASASLTTELLAQIKPWLPSQEFIFISAEAQPVGLDLLRSLPPPCASDQKCIEVQNSDVPLKVQAHFLQLPSTTSIESNEHLIRSGKAKLALPLGLEHMYLMVSSSSHKIDRLHRCINALRVRQALVFVASQGVAMYVWEKLMEKRVLVTVLHGGLSKLERTNVTRAFHHGEFRVLVATSMASRGLDFPGIDTVFNLSLPEDDVDYSHRSGRANRLGGAGNGRVVSIVSKGEVQHIEQVSRRLGIQIKEAAVAYGELLLQDECDSLPEEDTSAVERSWVPYKGGSRHSEDGPMQSTGMNERGFGGIRVQKGNMPFLNIL